MLCYDWYNGWYKYYDGIMLLSIFTFSSFLNLNGGLKGLHKIFFEVQQRSVKIKLHEIHFG